MQQFTLLRRETSTVVIEAADEREAIKLAQRMDHDDARWEFDDATIEVMEE